MERREFVAASLASVMAAPARVRIGFLGASHSHAEDKIRIVRESPAWELTGIVEKNPKLRAKFEKEGVRLLSQDQLLGDSSVQAIAIESDVMDHPAHARLALEAGKHIHLEKPPGYRRDDFPALVDLARRKRRLMQMGYMWRYHAGMNAAIEAARKGWLGDVYLVRGTMNTLIGADRRPEWDLFHGGQMFEQGGHLIDPMVRLMGKPQKITHFLKNHGRKYKDKLLDNTIAVFEYPGALGVVLSSVLQPNANAHRTFEILGTNGTAVLRPIEPGRLHIDLLEAAGPYKAGAQEVPFAPFRRYAGDFAELAEAIQNNRPLAITPDQDLAVQEVLLRASDMWE
jgi:predicted dehydrogenase